MKQIEKYIAIAQACSLLSKDSTKIGAVAIDYRNRIVGVGVNGYPSGYDDNDMDDKYSKVIHAEMNAVLNSNARPGEIKAIVLYGLPPCGECMKLLVAHGVREIYFAADKRIASADRWKRIFDSNIAFHGDYIKVKEISYD